MSNTKTRARAESLFDREKRREGEIACALEQERGRHEAVMRNMERLKALRLQNADGNGQWEVVRQRVIADVSQARQISIARRTRKNKSAREKASAS